MTFKKILMIQFVIVCIIGVGWVKNFIHLIDCDFEAPYKAEFIYTIGIIPFVGMITGWLDVGK